MLTVDRRLIEDCQNLAPNNFIFQQDGEPAHTSRLSQDRLERNTPDFIKKDEWPPNSPDLNPLDFHVWGAMLAKYQACTPKAKKSGVKECAAKDLGIAASRADRQGRLGFQKESAGVHCSRWRSL